MMDVKSLVDTLGCDVRMSPSDFWCLGPDAERDEFLSHQDRRALPVDIGEGDYINWRSIMTDHTLKRQEDYIHDINTRINKGLDDPKDVHIYDLDVNCTGFKKMTIERADNPQASKLMCLTSHGTIWHSSFERPLLAHEWMLTHGFPTLPQMQAPYKLPVNFDSMLRRGSINHSQFKSMAGLGWHAPSMGAYVFFTLASLEMWSDFEGIPARISAIEVDSSDEDEPSITNPQPPTQEEPRTKRFKHLNDSKGAVDDIDGNDSESI